MSQPYCLAMVLCDAIHQDATTGKFTILGTYSTVTSREFPVHIRVTVYFAVSDGHGKVPVYIKLVDAKSGVAPDAGADVFASDPTEIHFADPLMVVEGVFSFEAVLSEPGQYHCELYAGNHLLMMRRLLAVARPAEE